MVWDYAETNPFAGAGGDVFGTVQSACEVLEALCPGPVSIVKQLDATSAVNGVAAPLICTDPPYYDNIGYADLADFFYIWLRRSLQVIYPELFRTVLTPKAEELVATPYRFGGDAAAAQQFFEQGLRKAFTRMRAAHHADYPLALFYAFKQAESDEEEGENGGSGGVITSTGWETMLQGLVDTAFQITGTWPMRTEMKTRQVAMGANALASSIVLVCRPRPGDAPKASRAEFVRGLRKELPDALRQLQHGNIAPVDFAQAAIGPGMAVFSRYTAVLEADGRPMRVRTALGLINQVLDEVLAEQEAEFDAETRWALAWFEQHGHSDGPYGDAETLSKAKDVSVNGLEAAGILKARAGKVRLLRRDELDPKWDPATDRRLTVWEVALHLIRALASSESDAAQLLARAGWLGETARDLAYRLYTICDRKGWAEDARDYNALVAVWPEVTRKAAEAEQMKLV
jgi:putative DNA methylase